MTFQRRFAIRVFLALIVLVPFVYIGMIMTAKGNFFGAAPHKLAIAKVADANLKAMEQFCTGVVVTPKATWLVGRRELHEEDLSNDAVPDLSRLFSPDQDSKEQESHSAFAAMIGMRQERYLSFVSRLNNKGSFELIATVPEIACLQSSPNGEHVYLMTGLSRPKDESNPSPLDQTVIFQSDDQGKTWFWKKAGMFPEINRLAWDINPTEGTNGGSWLWQSNSLFDSPPSVEDSSATQPQPIGLQFSMDGGEHVENALSKTPLILNLKEIQVWRKKPLSWITDEDPDSVKGTTTQFVVPIDATHSAIWASQIFSYPSTPGGRLDRQYSITHFAQVRKTDHGWLVDKVERREGIAIQHILRNVPNEIIASAVLDEIALPSIIHLDPKQFRWEVKAKLPTAFGLISSWASIRTYFSTQHAIVVNTMGSHEVPRWVYPWGDRAPDISADAVFYSTDLGSTWRKLDIPGYLGILGVDAANDRVFWSDGNWYESYDLNIYSYDLK